MSDVCRMRNAGVRCPEVILLKKHILVLSFIGEHQKAAPKLKNAQLSPDDLQLAYEQCTEVRIRVCWNGGGGRRELSSL